MPDLVVLGHELVEVRRLLEDGQLGGTGRLEDLLEFLAAERERVETVAVGLRRQGLDELTKSRNGVDHLFS